MPKFVILTGKHQGQKMTLPEKDLVIGRDEDCQIRLVGSEVSRRHTQVRFINGECFVSDLGSRNGTLINDQVIKNETKLEPGDILRVGAMAFQLEGAKPKPPAKQMRIGHDGLVHIPDVTDDSIADWLNEDAPQGGTGDSTIVAKSASEETTTQPAVPKKVFSSLKEEAADIIRRHLETVRS